MHAMEARKLRKLYRGTPAVEDVDLHVEEGEILGVLGRNGAGKTTTVEMIAGLRRPDSGSVRILGLDPHRDRRQVREVLGVQLQSSALHSALTVDELVRLYRTFYTHGADPDELVDAVGLEAKRGTRFEKLSGGQQQRLSIALALVGRPRVVLLDELTTGLDPEARRKIWGLVERLRADGVAVLLVSHLMEEVERLCDRVTIIDRGRVAAEGTPTELVGSAGFEQQVSFRTREAFDTRVLDRLPEVTGVRVDGDRVEITGGGDLLQTVSTALVHGGVVATETRLQRATLDDAFLALTGRPLTEHEPTEPHGQETLR
ncbi:ABC transporter ATP-binding protein [Rhodococcus triatomae]|uniref:ABC-2 type transport system ATP-binding protein n=1 Tax=Rhodococcus triatomae TaxID=300028 RepID=A0A1G8GY74_9NOCA|nr:ABC transporter ATP-binding protein [Rhodococcus triatomae]QNG20264.1 ABC transporter ATP-binding protein [Rhodococcus triatomae]QNG23821.1 ABC transporter ATP-binding protein [Rhodococcus triatomae]SDH99299.1 ABC-2 type transport system ATP-binding protein [Rhodococcus triatomae]